MPGQRSVHPKYLKQLPATKEDILAALEFLDKTFPESKGMWILGNDTAELQKRVPK